MSQVAQAYGATGGTGRSRPSATLLPFSKRSTANSYGRFPVHPTFPQKHATVFARGQERGPVRTNVDAPNLGWLGREPNLASLSGKFLPGGTTLVTCSENGTVFGPPYREGREKGFAEGEAKGVAKGRVEFLFDMLEKRFGLVPPDVCKRLHAMKSGELTEVGMRLMEVQRIEDLFA